MQTLASWRTCCGIQNFCRAPQPRPSLSEIRSSSATYPAPPSRTPPSCSPTWASWWVPNALHCAAAAPDACSVKKMIPGSAHIVAPMKYLHIRNTYLRCAAVHCCMRWPQISLQVVNGPDHAGAVGPPPSHIVPAPLAVPDLAPPAGWRNVLQEKGPAGFAKVGISLRGLPYTTRAAKRACPNM
jgi:hypothetical protein